MNEDSTRIGLDLKNNGIRVYIMNTRYNQKEQTLERVSHWKEIYERITKLNKKEDTNKVNVILDTDIYNECDNQFALSYLLKSQDKCNIEAITVAPYHHDNSISILEGKEFNFKQDKKAVKEVFQSEVKLTIIPCKKVVSNLRTSIYELEHFLKGKNELGNYLCQRFYNDGVHGIQERRVIWDISVIAYMINKEWFETKEVSCPDIKEDTSIQKTVF